MRDSYLTLSQEASVETKVKGSRFIGETCRVETVEYARERLQTIRKREHAATHHCWAYRIGTEKPVEFKYSDDGEPSGTAGKPIFDMVEGSGVVNALVVVTRYYGGTKLGTGGLVRAYGEAARLALEKSGTRQCYLTDSFALDMAFSVYNAVQRLLSQLGAEIRTSDFSDRVQLQVSVRRSRSQQLIDQFVELTQGKGRCEKLAADS